jgi:hypothetical protein
MNNSNTEISGDCPSVSQMPALPESLTWRNEMILTFACSRLGIMREYDNIWPERPTPNAKR